MTEMRKGGTMTEMRKYPDKFWMCRTDRERYVNNCPAVKKCIELYPSLICHLGHR